MPTLCVSYGTSSSTSVGWLVEKEDDDKLKTDNCVCITFSATQAQTVKHRFLAKFVQTKSSVSTKMQMSNLPLRMWNLLPTSIF